MHPLSYRIFVAYILCALFVVQPLWLVQAEEISATTNDVSVTASDESESNEVMSDVPVESQPTTTTTIIETVEPVDEVTAVDLEEVSTEDVTAIDVDASSVPTGDTDDSGALSDLSQMLADLFTAEAEVILPAAAEILVIYELDQPIVIPVTPLQAVTIEEVPAEEPTFIEKIVDTVSDWLGGDNESDNTETVIDEDNTNNVDDNNIPEPETLPDVDDAEVIEPVQEVSPTDEVQAWLNIFPRVWAAEPEEEVDLIGEPPVIDEPILGPVDIATSTDVATTTATSTADTTVATSSTDAVLGAPIIPLVMVGTTSVVAALEKSPDGAYTVVLPPGSLPIGIHELQIATTTSAGEINERVVIDVGGGAVVRYPLESYGEVLISIREDGQNALWWWQTAPSGEVSITRIIPYGQFSYPSPLAFFDGVLFALTKTGDSLVGTDLISNTSFSQTLEPGGLATELPLRSGRYFVTPNDIDFQFVSVEGAVY